MRAAPFALRLLPFMRHSRSIFECSTADALAAPDEDEGYDACRRDDGHDDHGYDPPRGERLIRNGECDRLRTIRAVRPDVVFGILQRDRRGVLAAFGEGVARNGHERPIEALGLHGLLLAVCRKFARERRNGDRLAPDGDLNGAARRLMIGCGRSVIDGIFARVGERRKGFGIRLAVEAELPLSRGAVHCLRAVFGERRVSRAVVGAAVRRNIAELEGGAFDGHLDRNIFDYVEVPARRGERRIEGIRACVSDRSRGSVIAVPSKRALYRRIAEGRRAARFEAGEQVAVGCRERLARHREGRLVYGEGIAGGVFSNDIVSAAAAAEPDREVVAGCIAYGLLCAAALAAEFQHEGDLVAVDEVACCNSDNNTFAVIYCGIDPGSPVHRPSYMRGVR